MAAGLTVTADRLKDAEAFLYEAIAKAGRAAPAVRSLEVDAALTASGADASFIAMIEKAGPYGQGNPQPRFVLPSHRVKFAKIVGESHVRVLLEAADGSRVDAVAFRAAGQPLGDALMGAGGMPLHLAGSFKRDTWGGREKIEMQIEDAADPRSCD
jgi:single-stranded-DNA-specific exonuclease